MTKLQGFFRIGLTSDDNVYLGLSPDAVGGTVINTLDGNIVFRIEVYICIITSSSSGVHKHLVYITVEQSKANSKLDLGAKVVS